MSDTSHARATEGTGRKRQPLHRTVADELRRRLLEGRLLSGAKLPALRELADEFNVSTMTIRQALRLLEREGHVSRIPAVGAFVRSTSATAADRQPVTIAFVVVDLTGEFDVGLARGIEDACQKRGWGVQIFDDKSDSELESRNLERLLTCGVRGAVVLPVGRDANVESLFRLKLANFPLVLVDRAVPGLRVDLVESDHEKGAHLLTRHLIEAGHRHILMVADWRDLSSIADRVRGYERALLEHDIEPRRDWKVWLQHDTAPSSIEYRRRWQAACAAALPALKSAKLPVAVFAQCDVIAWGVLEACRELELRVPEDVSIVCFDDSSVVTALTPRLTTAAQRTNEIGHRAVALLERRLQHGSYTDLPPEHVLVDVDLIQRESVAVVREAVP